MRKVLALMLTAAIACTTCGCNSAAYNKGYNDALRNAGYEVDEPEVAQEEAVEEVTVFGADEAAVIGNTGHTFLMGSTYEVIEPAGGSDATFICEGKEDGSYQYVAAYVTDGKKGMNYDDVVTVWGGINNGNVPLTRAQYEALQNAGWTADEKAYFLGQFATVIDMYEIKGDGSVSYLYNMKTRDGAFKANYISTYFDDGSHVEIIMNGDVATYADIAKDIVNSIK